MSTYPVLVNNQLIEVVGDTSNIISFEIDNNLSSHNLIKEWEKGGTTHTVTLHNNISLSKHWTFLEALSTNEGIIVKFIK